MSIGSDSTELEQSAAPWLDKKEWAAGKIVFSTGEQAAGVTAIAAAVDLISVLLWFALRDELLVKRNWSVLFGLIAPALGLFLTAVAVMLVRRWRYFGVSVFEMASVPGVIGGRLAGVIRTSAKIQPESGYRLTLNCIRWVRHGDSTDDNIIWQDEQIIARELLSKDPAHSAIPVLFQIPDDCQPTGEASDWDRTQWQLELTAKTAGPKYAATFEVPVFKTADSDPNFVVDRRPIADYAAPETPDADLREAGVVKLEHPAGDGCRLLFPMGRARVLATIVALTGLIFGSTPFLVCYLAPREFLISKVATVVLFGGFGLLALWASADMWFYCSIVDVSPNGSGRGRGLVRPGPSPAHRSLCHRSDRHRDFRHYVGKRGLLQHPRLVRQ